MLIFMFGMGVSAPCTSSMLVNMLTYTHIFSNEGYYHHVQNVSIDANVDNVSGSGSGGNGSDSGNVSGGSGRRLMLFEDVPGF
jgi:hypothetical protein